MCVLKHRCVCLCVYVYMCVCACVSMSMCVCMFVYVYMFMCRNGYVQKSPEEDDGSSGTGIAGNYEPPNMGGGNRSHVLYKGDTCL